MDNLLAALVFAADRLTKVWARRWLAVHGPVRVLPFFYLTYVENTGAAFGLGRGANRRLLAIAVALIAGVLVWRRKVSSERERWTHAALSLVLGGAIGNLYDRIAYGWVTDFLDFRVWPVFNVADSAICVGAGLLALVMWLQDHRKAAVPS